jgi:hypothetical protein
LANPPRRFIWKPEPDFLRQFRELGSQHFMGAAQNDVPTLARRHAAENQNIAEFVEVRVVRDAMSHITANGLENPLCSRLPGSGHFLNEFELLRGAEALVQADPSLGSQAKDRLLLMNSASKTHAPSGKDINPAVRPQD